MSSRERPEEPEWEQMPASYPLVDEGATVYRARSREGWLLRFVRPDGRCTFGYMPDMVPPPTELEYA